MAGVRHIPAAASPETTFGDSRGGAKGGCVQEEVVIIRRKQGRVERSGECGDRCVYAGNDVRTRTEDGLRVLNI